MVELFEAEIVIKDKRSKECVAINFTANFISGKIKLVQIPHYFLDSKQQLKERAATGFNKIGGRAYGFVHSVYIQSGYFDTFSFSKAANESNTELALDGDDNDQRLVTSSL